MIINYFQLYATEKETQSFNQTLYWLRRFEKDTKLLTFHDVNQLFYNNFRDYLTQNGIGECTFGKHIKNIKAFMRWAGDHDLHKNKDWKLMRVIKKQADDQALNSEELTRLWNASFSMKTVIKMIEEKDRINLSGPLAEVRFKSFLNHRDIFLAMCSSGMYINDLLNFSQDNIIDNSYVKYTRYKKSGQFDSVCIFDYEKDEVFKFKELAKKHDYNFRIKRRSIYTDVKVMMQYLEINKNITTKSGRKTWASIWYFEREAPIFLVMKGLGHTKEESTRHYLRADDSDIVNQFRKRKPMIKAGKINPLKKAV